MIIQERGKTVCSWDFSKGSESGKNGSDTSEALNKEGTNSEWHRMTSKESQQAAMKVGSEKTNPENFHQGEGIQVEEVMLETENLHHPAEEAVKVIFIGHRPMNGRKALDSPGITGLVQK